MVGVAFPVGVLGSSFKRIYDSHFEKLRSRIIAKKKRVAREAGSSKHPRRNSAADRSGKLGGLIVPKRGIHPTPPIQGQESGKGHGSTDNNRESSPRRDSLSKMEPIKVSSRPRLHN